MTLSTANIVDEVVSHLQKLLPDKQQLLLAFAEFLLYQQAQTQEVRSNINSALLPVSDKIVASEGALTQSKQRVFGQYRGQIWMSEDFDAPLPDNFWVGDS
jgi:Protein of unknown function (DUF2281)